jgi:hypothetical protein
MTNNLLNEVEFNNLTLNEKRVAIAKDVIIRINNNNFLENRGQILNGEIFSNKNTNPKESINTKQCEVCARGALLCSWIGNFNNVGWDELSEFDSSSNYPVDYGSSTFPSPLLEVFDREMLDNIEAAFEADTFSWHYNMCKTQQYVDAFDRTYEDEDGDEYRAGTPIIELMEWIITNKGEFPLPE